MTLRLNKRGIRGVKAHYDPHYDPGPFPRPFFHSEFNSNQPFALSQSTGARTWGKGAECGGGPEGGDARHRSRALLLAHRSQPCLAPRLASRPRSAVPVLPASRCCLHANFAALWPLAWTRLMHGCRAAVHEQRPSSFPDSSSEGAPRRQLTPCPRAQHVNGRDSLRAASLRPACMPSALMPLHIARGPLTRTLAGFFRRSDARCSTGG